MDSDGLSGRRLPHQEHEPSLHAADPVGRRNSDSVRSSNEKMHAAGGLSTGIGP